MDTYLRFNLPNLITVGIMGLVLYAIVATVGVILKSGKVPALSGGITTTS